VLLQPLGHLSGFSLPALRLAKKRKDSDLPRPTQPAGPTFGAMLFFHPGRSIVSK
jgi:hypothetical protein